MNIVLVCNAGMSTSVLVKKMEDEAATRGLTLKIAAYSVEVLDEVLAAEKVDCVLVGPQIRHMMPNVKKAVNDTCPVEMIDMRDYGTINAKAVLERAISLINT